MYATLTLDSSAYEEGLDSAASTAETKGSSIGSKLATIGGSVAKATAVAVTAVATATAAASSAVWSGANQVAEYADNVDKMSQKIGISSDSYQEWSFVMEHCGTSIDSMQAGMKSLSTAAESNSDSFQKLGISEEQVANLSQEELFSAVIAGLQGMEEGTERTVIATELLGRGATDMGALLNMSAEDTAALKQQIYDLGGVLSEDAVAAGATFEDSLTNLQTSFSGLKNGLLGDFLPSMTTVMDGITALMSGQDGALEQINSGIHDFLTSLVDMIPEAADTAASIVMSLLDALLDNLPEIVDAGIDVIISLTDGLMDALPKLVEKAPEIIKSLVEGLNDALPKLVDEAAELIVCIVETLSDNLPEIVEMGLTLIVTLATALIEALPKLVEKAPEIIVAIVKGVISSLPKIVEATGEIIKSIMETIAGFASDLAQKGKDIIDNIKNGIKQKIDDAKQWGKDLIQNFLDGIMQKWNDLKNTVSNVASTVKSFLGFSEPEEGPLSNFHTYAPDMMKLFAKGIADNEDIVSNQLNKSLSFDNVVSANVKTSSAAGTAAGRTGSIINVYAQSLSDAQIDYVIGQASRRLGAQLA